MAILMRRTLGVTSAPTLSKRSRIVAQLALARSDGGSRCRSGTRTLLGWAGLDVGLRSTSVCVVDADGKVAHQVSMKSDPTEIGRYLRKNFTSNIATIGLESGGTSGHLATHLRRQGFQVAVLDATQTAFPWRSTTPGIAYIFGSGTDHLAAVQRPFDRSRFFVEIGEDQHRPLSCRP